MVERNLFFIMLLFLASSTVCAQNKPVQTEVSINNNRSFSPEKAYIVPAVPSDDVVNRPFGEHDRRNFANPPKVNYPQTWFHYIDGNVDKDGITKDLEAIAGAGISGIQFFHGGNFGGDWPGVTDHIYCLTEKWDDLVKHTADEASRLGLRFTMQNCPGWAMSGGPWIDTDNTMRHVVASRTDFAGPVACSAVLPLAEEGHGRNSDYRDIMVLAFPTPLDDSPDCIRPLSVKCDEFQDELLSMLSGKDSKGVVLSAGKHSLDVSFDGLKTVRTLVLSSVNGFCHGFAYEPGVHFLLEAVLQDGSRRTVLDVDAPMASWQDDKTLSLACDDAVSDRYVLTVTNSMEMSISILKMFSAARKNNWEAESARTLRAIPKESANPSQNHLAYLDREGIIDISDKMDADGKLAWDVPEGRWTVLRVGHVNTGMRNGPAPKEATGWECDKLSKKGADTHFASYIGRLADSVVKGKVQAMLMDSWECRCQTWTDGIEEKFEEYTGYGLRKWIPALFGYVVDDNGKTSRFLDDWRSFLNSLLVNNYFGEMASNARSEGLDILYETASGDIFPGDIMEYYKFADVPMCEFWQHSSETFLGSFNFKSIRPTASAAHLYDKKRVAAESFTSFELTWDEHLGTLFETANQNFAQGVTHLVFHTYTHNPCADEYVPGTSFGSSIGTPFIRNQTWWKYMPEFTGTLARCSYMLERGKPANDVLWYLGDETTHKPDQYYDFPKGYKYDYCNKDVLLNGLSVDKDGNLVTDGGTQYRVLWLKDNDRLCPETVARLKELVLAGATVIGDPPREMATLSLKGACGFEPDVRALWPENVAVNHLGRGMVISSMSLADALRIAGVKPDLLSGSAIWLHRKVDGADIYFVAAPRWKDCTEVLSIRGTGTARIWNPVDGEIAPAVCRVEDGRTLVDISLARGNSRFIVFEHGITPSESESDGIQAETVPLGAEWTLSFPEGWGAPEKIKVRDLKAWKDLGLSEEASAFSGTVKYTTKFRVKTVKQSARYILDLGNVEMIASVSLNGKHFRPVWMAPYCLDVTEAIRTGQNVLEIDVTSTWFNRLAYDAGQDEADRKTWTICGPEAGSSLRESGLLGPVTLVVK